MLKRLIVVAIISIFAINLANAQDAKMSSFQDSVAYAIGVQIGSNLKQDSLMFNLDIVKQGMYDALYKGQPKLDEMKMGMIMQKFQQDLMNKQQEKASQIAQKNLKNAEEFLAKNKTKKGVITTESGLQYEVVKKGEGKYPVSTDTVEVHYEGKLLNGDVFDSSFERGETVEFPLDRVIKGWTEGVQLMNEGSKYIFYIHPNLGYGERGAGQDIGPNELLIFTVELIKVKQGQ